MDTLKELAVKYGCSKLGGGHDYKHYWESHGRTYPLEEAKKRRSQ